MHRGIVVLLVVCTCFLLAWPAAAGTPAEGAGEVTGLQLGLAAAAVLVAGLGVGRLRRSRTAPARRTTVSSGARDEPPAAARPERVAPPQTDAPDVERLPRAAVARLNELRQLHEQGRISDEEFLGRTQAVLDAF